MHQSISQQLKQGRKEGQKFFAWLIDPDQFTKDALIDNLQMANQGGVDFIFVGGSLLMADQMDECLDLIKQHSDIPVIIFPGNALQYNEKADGMLFLSLISGRNPDLLIGRHVEIAPILKQSSLEIFPTGYMLIDSGQTTTAAYISNTQPIPHQKADIATSTALAGELLGLKHIYLDGGSGAAKPVSEEMISSVSRNVDLPVIVGGGIKTAEDLEKVYNAGADVAVVGNAIEDQKDLLKDMMEKQANFRSNGH